MLIVVPSDVSVSLWTNAVFLDDSVTVVVSVVVLFVSTERSATIMNENPLPTGLAYGCSEVWFLEKAMFPFERYTPRFQ